MGALACLVKFQLPYISTADYGFKAMDLFVIGTVSLPNFDSSS